MGNWHVFVTNRKSSNQATLFILIVVIVSVLIGFFFRGWIAIQDLFKRKQMKK